MIDTASSVVSPVTERVGVWVRGGGLGLNDARRALFAWAWARRVGAPLTLRVTGDGADATLSELRWLGVDADEVRVDDGGAPTRWSALAEQLVQSRGAYWCGCSREALDAQRSALPERARERWRYPGTCRDRTAGSGAPRALRLRAPGEGRARFVDAVFGETGRPCEDVGDVVLMRSDGTALYTFATLGDAIDMGITLAVRDHAALYDAATWLLAYRALGEEPPRFAHVPTLLGSPWASCMRREARVEPWVAWYRAQEWPPEALCNALARHGWSFEEREVFARAEMAERFEWSRLRRRVSRFDVTKARWLAEQHRHRATG